MKSTPLVSVVMSVYNGEKYLRESMDSILNQTFTDFEFIIIDDGSTDESTGIIKSYKDARIRYVHQTNHGLIHALNKGLDLAQADLVARMDADDIADSGRLAEQVRYMAEHPSCVLVGGNLVFIDNQGEAILNSPLLLGDAELRLEMLIRSPFGHPAVMYRKDAVTQTGGYDSDYRSAEDYDLWARLGQLGSFANINKVVLQYRVHEAGVSLMSSQEQFTNTARIRERLWEDPTALPIVPSLASLTKDYPSTPEDSKIQTGRLADVYRDVIHQAIRRRYYSYALRVAWAVIKEPGGYVGFAKSLKRKLWRKP